MRLFFIILKFSYLLRRYSFLFYRGKVRKKDETTKQYIMYFNKDIADYQSFTNAQMSMFSLLRYLTDLNDIPLIIAERVLYGITQAFLPVLK